MRLKYRKREIVHLNRFSADEMRIPERCGSIRAELQFSAAGRDQRSGR
jgi:hypothetical protein